MALVVALFLLLVDEPSRRVTFGGLFIIDGFAVF